MARRSSIALTSPDPLINAPGPAGSSPLNAGSPAMERGTVLETDARRHSYRVSLNSGRTVSMGRIASGPGDTTLLAHGTPVVVTWALGLPYILGVLPLDVAHSDDGPTLTAQNGHGGQDPALDRHLPASSRNPNAPVDMLPGDALLQGPDGAFVGGLRGKHAVLSGGPLAEIHALGDSDRLETRAGERRDTTWMGYSETVNEGGKTSFRFRGGSDQLTQTGPDEGRYTIKLDVGESGDLVRFELCNREGQALFRAHVDSHGRLELFAAGGIAQTHGDGADALQATAHHGSAEHEVTGDSTHVTGGAHRHTAGTWRTVVDGLAELMSGGAINLVGTDRIEARSGGQIMVAAAELATLAGKGVTVAPGLDRFFVDTGLPDMIVLGQGAVSHGVMYEQLVPVLQIIVRKLDALASAFATHTHPVVLTPTPTASPNPAYAAFATPTPFVPAPMKSVLVKLR